MSSRDLALLIVLLSTPARAADPAQGHPGQGDPVQGRRQFAPCSVCHTVGAGEPDKIGPNLHGLFGRTAGTRPGYSYSAAMKKAGFVWTEEKVAAYITKPQAVVPGNKMSFPGVPNDGVRDNVIAYLKDATK